MTVPVTLSQSGYARTSVHTPPSTRSSTVLLPVEAMPSGRPYANAATASDNLDDAVTRGDTSATTVSRGGELPPAWLVAESEALALPTTVNALRSSEYEK